MCRRRSLILLIVSGLVVGCVAPPQERPASWLGRLRAPPTITGANRVVMEAALIERPVGDPGINQELWGSIDEQVIPLERKGLITDNGFRIGIISGMPPPGLLTLLTSERSCPSPRRIIHQAGEDTSLLLGQTIEQCRFQLWSNGSAETIELEQAQGTLLVVPTLTADGRTQLKFTPQVQHGVGSPMPRPVADRSGTYSWMRKEQRPLESFAGVEWEVTLAPNDYVVVGGAIDRPETLGHRFFIRADEPVPVQRLLVIRTNRTRPGVKDEAAPNGVPSLALQAQLAGRKP